MKIYVQAGPSFGTGVTSALAEASNLSFSASGLTNVGSLRNLSRAWSGTDQGLDIQYLYSTADLSQVDWRLAGQLRLAYSGPSNANIDERLKFNIKVGQGVPTPGAVSALALAGLVATRRRR
jgi:MYXO-CTERM domain-containing protein